MTKYDCILFIFPLSPSPLLHMVVRKVNSAQNFFATRKMKNNNLVFHSL